MWVYFALKKRRLSSSGFRSSLSSSSSGMPFAIEERTANMLNLDVGSMTPISLQLRLRNQFVNNCSYWLADQPFREPIHILDRERLHSPFPCANEPNAQWFPVRVEVAIDNVLEVSCHCRHVGKVLVAGSRCSITRTCNWLECASEGLRLAATMFGILPIVQLIDPNEAFVQGMQWLNCYQTRNGFLARSIHHHSVKDCAHLRAVAVLIIEPGAQVGVGCDLGDECESLDLISNDL